MTQEPLWHDTPEDALRSVVDGIGGLKRAGSALWPGKEPGDAGRHLSRCLDPERPEKLALGDVVLILQWGRKRGIHTGMSYLAQQSGYHARPVEPEDERAVLQREYIEAAKTITKISQRMEQLVGDE